MTMSPVERSATARADRLARELDGLSHPVRLRVVLASEGDPVSPTALAAQLRTPLGTVAYHVRCLAAIGLLELVASRPRRGALEHLYELTPRGRLLREVALELMRSAA